jgi:hypothetical protein
MPGIDELLKKYGGELSSVLPLILLFAFWWIFSMLGSKVRKTGTNNSEAESPGLQERFLRTIGGDQSENQEPRGQMAESGPYEVYRPEENSQNNQGGPGRTGTIQPRPINPRWWGA